MQDETTVLLKQVNLDISPGAKIAELKVGQQQLVEIAKALYTNADVIIMDEPTSAISDKECEKSIFYYTSAEIGRQNDCLYFP